MFTFPSWSGGANPTVNGMYGPKYEVTAGALIIKLTITFGGKADVYGVLQRFSEDACSEVKSKLRPFLANPKPEHAQDSYVCETVYF